MSMEDKQAVIEINGVTFTTDNAFLKYRESHQFRVGDAVNVLVKKYSGLEVRPGFIVGVNDFGANKDGKSRFALTVAYVEDDYARSLKIDNVFNDACETETNTIAGIAPVNEYNDLTVQFGDVYKRMTDHIRGEEMRLEALKKQAETLKAALGKLGVFVSE